MAPMPAPNSAPLAIDSGTSVHDAVVRNESSSNSKLVPSVNALAAPLAHDLILQAKTLRLGVERLVNGCVAIDAGISFRGGLEAVPAARAERLGANGR